MFVVTNIILLYFQNSNLKYLKKGTLPYWNVFVNSKFYKKDRSH